MPIPTSFHLAPSPLYSIYYHYSVFTTKQVLARGANWGCYGLSLVLVLPQPPGPPAPLTLRPWQNVASSFLWQFYLTEIRNRYSLSNYEAKVSTPKMEDDEILYMQHYILW